MATDMCRRAVAELVPEPFSVEETRRVARLARLGLTPDEEARLARELRDITRAFSDLDAWAAALPEPAEGDAAPLREDVAAPEDRATTDRILAQAPRVEPGTRLVRVPRGGPGA